MNNQKPAEINKSKTKSKLSTSDLFFLSFGGQAPFISLLTFGTVMISLVGTQGAFAMLIATAVVALNGIVVNRLSSRFKRGGGYYTYAYYALTERLGTSTGWVYLAYALSYGGTLLAGGAYVLYSILRMLPFTPAMLLNQWLLALVVSGLASALVIAGVKASAKYAMVMSTAEMIALIALSVFFLRDSGWHFYNPFTVNLSPSLFEAVVFGLGIPTGYGSIAPLGYDASSKSIGKVAVAVVFYGGLLASFFFYSLGALNFTGNLVQYLLSDFGIVGAIILGFIALNDGTLGGMSYILANSRTLKAMSEDKVFPSILAKDVRGKPLYAEILIAGIFTSAVVALTNFMGLYGVFVILGGLAGIFNLFIHSSADLSLVRITVKRAKKHWWELSIGILATLVSTAVLIYSFTGFSPIMMNIFLGWIVLGFFYLEIKEMLSSTED
ncbi:amino acid permease-associated region [Acidianus hospitalis W1]|uniref:Amino acid permease-associated region n=1 Tax=Acidianus hospitalis (strain W1) TaxID=933801 RepID=F4B7N3_ACIHW|nr:APC family permease [Acidianus hospitalis]AEE94780.1 amino acid permease-associated region [Acidianus hospitalis W1]